MIPKFRVWLKKEKEMYPVYTLLFTPTGELEQVVPVNTEEYKTNNYYWSDPESIKDVVLMQSTGVKDCNGTEIYEGDIVEIIYYKQVWDAIPAYCGSRKAKYDYRIDSLEDFFYTRKSNHIADSELKVLGNIHENPELKKGGNS
jgi:uncharacterized phage protein (TIGR01671 family)